MSTMPRTCHRCCTALIASITPSLRPLAAIRPLTRSMSSSSPSDRLRSSFLPPSSSYHRSSPECSHRRSSIARQYATSSSSVASSAPESARRRRRAIQAASLILAALSGVLAWRLLTAEEEPRLAIDRFVPLKLTSITRLTPETSSFKFALPRSLLSKDEAVDRGGATMSLSQPIKSVYLMQPELQIQRPYTPVSARAFDRSDSGKEEMELIVKRYPDGEVSRWMHRLNVGDEVRVRGPTITWDYRDGQYDEVIFIVGGTGISPAHQFVEHELARQSSSIAIPKLSIIYSSPTPSTILLQSSLDRLSLNHPDQVSLYYLVDGPDKDSAGKNSNMAALQGKTVGRVSKKHLDDWIGAASKVASESRRMIVVCGPEGMVNTVAGPRARNQSQGPVGGILGELGYSSSQVVKL